MRQYTEFNSDFTRSLLNELVDQCTSTQAYRLAMFQLGNALAGAISTRIKDIQNKSFCVACTVEDADFLAKGIIDGLGERGVSDSQVKLVCFWNERINPFEVEGVELDIAPILKQYTEPVDINSSIVIVVKSIVSGACVVKTNLSTIIEKSNPRQVLVASPVMLKGSKERLASEFKSEISGRFEYITFAIDDQKSEDGKEVVPGIGGSVYGRLGLGSQAEKNTYVPEIIKERRKKLWPVRAVA